MSTAVKIESRDARSIPFQEASLDIWDKKYRLTAKDGTPIDHCMDDTYKRVARALADVEREEVREHWYEQFVWALRRGAIPAGRVTSNAGAQEHKPATSTINCTVSGTIRDSMDDILGKVHEAGLTLKAGCGIGYEFSTLRPRGAYVSGAGAYTSGPLSFMDIYDKMCFTVSSAGGRRGAQMGTFDVGHPDAMEFIRAKREAGRLRQFNLSLLVTDEFMKAVREDRDWKLAFPVTATEVEGHDTADAAKFVWREWPTSNGYVRNDEGLVLCKVYKTLPAKRMWDVIMSSTYDFAEPGFVLVDRVNEMNNNWWCENIRATNPCGEQPLPPYGSCLLGSINLTSFVRDPFADDARFDWDEYRAVVKVFTRMLDNVVEVNGLPLEQQRNEIMRKRRHGMGFLGLGSTITMLGMKYGSRDAVAFTERVSKELALAGWEAALDLAREKGPAPIMLEEFEVTPEMLRKRPEMKRDGVRAGQKLPGRVLHARYSRYMQRVAEAAPELVDELAKVGARFTHHSSIAPTGTISLSLANNASNGIEPSFAHHYFRNVIREGRKTKERIDVFSFELLAYRELVNRGAMPGGTTADRQVAGVLHDRRRRHAARARRHPGRGAEVGRLVDLEDGQRPDRLPLRRLQGHLPVRARAGPQGLHHVPLQPGGVPGRAGQGRGPEEHHLRVHARRRHRGVAQGRRADRVRRRDAHRGEPVRRAEGRLLRQVLRRRRGGAGVAR